ncbi:hypothetical protein SDRG_02773 [Saprolegnia diclina VS20]|uniref:Uncharacterized protein n=1 Tax=Saprolegnia diclina (strain VS20) TaxID=1156394 RepID=T0SBI7_SAPDV|nr:hypothetical protein SDRG_02773 [Saprolegnia diclina VS20]EQC40122.1 hypothetical protein SDRG_02773 [Saprolegnia diclina VS20]|eukprot:XP_008606596.1 hypothetical protein SDRG_02773 [Saprolegnia diclina VS20]
MDDAAIVGIVVGALVLVGGLAAVLFLRYRSASPFKSETLELPMTLSRGGGGHSYVASPLDPNNNSTFVPWLLKASSRQSNDSMSLDQSIASTTEPNTDVPPDANARDSFWDRLSPSSRDQIRSESSIHRGSSASRLYQSSSIPMIEVRTKRSESYDTASDASGFETMRSFVSSAIIDKDDQELRPSTASSARSSS